MNDKPNGEAILNAIGNLDEVLTKHRDAYVKMEGMEIPEDKTEEFQQLREKITRLMILRKRLAKYMLDTYGVFVFNGWES